MDQVPTPAELRRYLRSHNLSQRDAAGLVGVSRDTFRKFVTDATRKNHRPIPFGTWYTLTDRVSRGHHKPQAERLENLPYFENEGE